MLIYLLLITLKVLMILLLFLNANFPTISSFQNLETINNLTINNNTSLTDVIGFDSITSINSMSVTGNYQLQVCCFMYNLAQIIGTGSINISSNGGNCNSLLSIYNSSVSGCTDSLALTTMHQHFAISGSCLYAGCMDSLAVNYDSIAVQDDGSARLAGCTYSAAINYNSQACLDDGSCIFGKTYVPDDNFESYLEANGMGDSISSNDSVSTIFIYNFTNSNISNQGISDLTGIEDFLNDLKHLYCDSNQLNNLDLSTNVLLETLHCGNNQLSSLDLTNFPELSDLECQNNNLTTLDCSSNTLEKLYCYNNQLSSVYIQNAQQQLVLSSNKLQTYNNSNLYCIQIDEQLSYFK